MKDKIITALKEEVALLEQANVTQIDKHIYTMEKLLDILKEDKIIIDRPVDEIMNKHEVKEDKSDSIFDF